jgi:hypothetical protein
LAYRRNTPFKQSGTKISVRYLSDASSPLYAGMIERISGGNHPGMPMSDKLL